MAEKLVSVLEIYDFTTKTRSVLAEFDYRIEAPNWSPDGKFLVYNSGGLIYKFDLATKAGARIDTGDCTQCNNDHVLSADGKWLAISASGGGYGSRVWILPIGGGAPRLVTPDAPSYLHGWSPDMKTLAYCAERGGEFDIYTVDADGGEETRLTDAPGLSDGPEYSPDGTQIWFNSVRSGLMQAYRMQADGSGQTQMTFEEDWNSWFPHISPDGEKVVFVAYKKGDVAPGDHPANKHIEVRYMSARGGAPETLFAAFGGQGTMNVNSWSPDSEKFAFVTYRLG